eukprot:2792478-Rhodomonas_salina.3
MQCPACESSSNAPIPRACVCFAHLHPCVNTTLPKLLTVHPSRRCPHASPLCKPRPRQHPSAAERLACPGGMQQRKRTAFEQKLCVVELSRSHLQVAHRGGFLPADAMSVRAQQRPSAL